MQDVFMSCRESQEACMEGEYWGATLEVYVALLNIGEDYSLGVNWFLLHILPDKRISFRWIIVSV